MDTNMEDVGRVAEPSRLSPVVEPTTISTLDGWIESLMTCKQLAEVDVQRLCEKVRKLSLFGFSLNTLRDVISYSDADCLI